jgi:hypothetical protein
MLGQRSRRKCKITEQVFKLISGNGLESELLGAHWTSVTLEQVKAMTQKIYSFVQEPGEA